MRYLLIHYLQDDAEAEVAEAEVQAWVTEMETSGVKLYGGELGPAGEAATVRVRDGGVLVTDGPFAETKEQIAGFDVLECASLDEAVKVAARHPTAQAGAFELREIFP